jgi:hypothetical protein
LERCAEDGKAFVTARYHDDKQNIEKIPCCGMRFAESGSERKNHDREGKRKKQFGLKLSKKKAIVI